MITKDIAINKFTRMRYFDGLFLQQGEFRADQDFYLAVRRYLNYLLFEPGVLCTVDPGSDITNSSSLQVSSGAGLSINVAPGVGLVRDSTDSTNRNDPSNSDGMAYEVVVSTAQAFDAADIATAGLDAAGSVIRVILHRDDNEFILNASAEDRAVERAQISLVAPSDLDSSTIPPGEFASIPHIELATLVVNAASDGFDLYSDDRTRGGLKLSILSDDVYTMLGSGPAPTSPPTLSGFTEVPAGGTFSVINGAHFPLTTVGVQFNTSSGSTLAMNFTPTSSTTIQIDNSIMLAGDGTGATRGRIILTVLGHDPVESTFDYIPPPRFATPRFSVPDVAGALNDSNWSISQGPMRILGETSAAGGRFYSPVTVRFENDGTGEVRTNTAASSSTTDEIVVLAPSGLGTGLTHVRIDTAGGRFFVGDVTVSS